MQTLIVRSSLGDYQVEWSDLEKLAGSLPVGPIITDSNVQAAIGRWLPKDRPLLAVRPGEPSKCLSVFETCLEWLAEVGANRSTLLVALGGGVVGDLAGYVASSYMRGIGYVQVPTTLLAQVDSSVGGKVAIDLRAGKNLAGAFHPPTKVIVVPEALRTLPVREFNAGMAEVWKTGYILDSQLLNHLRSRSWQWDTPELALVVRRCIEIKAEVVEQDEFETKGLRAVLNFGHTIGHAIEKVQGYGEWLHGEAVALGMVAEARLGEQLGVTPLGTADMIADDLRQQGLPTSMPDLDVEALLQAMRSDKKATAQGLAFSLLTGPGTCKLFSGVAESDVCRVLG